MTNKLRILVIDDKPENIVSAKEQIGDEYDLTTVSSYHEACKLLSSKEFDVVLTDLFMPVVESHAERLGDKHKNKEHPYGLIFVFKAIEAGVKMIGIVSSEDHHFNAFMFPVEDITGTYSGGIKKYGETILAGSYAKGPTYQTYDDVSGKMIWLPTKRWDYALKNLLDCSK